MAVLEITDLIKTFTTPEGDRQTVLDVPHFALERGEQVALLGESGLGKTTLLHTIAGIHRPDSGCVHLAEVEMSRLSEGRRDRLRAEAIGYVFQTFNLLQGYSALENVELAMMFGRGVDRDRARHLLERVGLGDRLHHRPRQLSVGQQQRVAVARALANQPALVLADEPTGNLDASSAQAVMHLMRQACDEAGAAMLVVTHDPRAVDGLDRTVELAQLNRASREPADDPAVAPAASMQEQNP